MLVYFLLHCSSELRYNVNMIFRHLKNRRFPVKENNVKGKLFYDPEEQEPVIRCSICTGEQVAGFQDRDSGRFEEIMLIKSPQDLQAFRLKYGIEGELQKIY